MGEPPIVRIGTAGWQAPKEILGSEHDSASHLVRYSHALNAVEINSSFYRRHRRETYQRWADSTPDDFRFCVKAPKTITHEAKLVNCVELIGDFAEEAGGLGAKFEVMLLQLPPKLSFDETRASLFLAQVRSRLAATVVLEPRHETWFTEKADAFFHSVGVARASADPPRSPNAKALGGSTNLAYFRWHGSPRIYYSNYELPKLEAIAAELKAKAACGTRTWCVFDNTAANAAIRNALTTTELVSRG